MMMMYIQVNLCHMMVLFKLSLRESIECNNDQFEKGHKNMLKKLTKLLQSSLQKTARVRLNS
uniref:Uncharacterized protein n=1 Tax=Arion vulgaris TaxID=1028688 RepID=A0A0B7BPE1_9EUPU